MDLPYGLLYLTICHIQVCEALPYYAILLLTTVAQSAKHFFKSEYMYPPLSIREMELVNVMSSPSKNLRGLEGSEV